MLQVMVACPDCPAARDARAMFLEVDLLFNLVVTVLVFAVCIAAALSVVQLARRAAGRGDRSSWISAGLFLGMGLGGFVDGIALHQILQWHHMLSSRVPPVTVVAIKYNMIWDGLFHALTWTLVVIGAVQLFRAGRRCATMGSGRALLGAVLGGGGLFDVVEGVIDHELLGIHHVRPGPHLLAWDLGYLIFGAALMVIGAALATRRGEPRPAVAGG